MKLVNGQFVKHKMTGRHGIVFISSNRLHKTVIFEDMTKHAGIFNLNKNEFCKPDMTLLEWQNYKYK
jgi:hypothetical protein